MPLLNVLAGHGSSPTRIGPDASVKVLVSFETYLPIWQSRRFVGSKERNDH